MFEPEPILRGSVLHPDASIADSRQKLINSPQGALKRMPLYANEKCIDRNDPNKIVVVFSFKRSAVFHHTGYFYFVLSR